MAQARKTTLSRPARAPDPALLQGARNAALPRIILPQLATLVDTAPSGNEWLHEVKLDGYRMLARIDGARTRLVTRNGNDWTAKFEPLVAALGKLKLRSALLDGEIVHLNPDGTSSFGGLQEDLSEERPDRLTYFVFDLLALDGHLLTGCVLEDRKRVLETVVKRAPRGSPIRYSDHVEGHGPAFFAKACAAKLEGIISKRRRDPYVSGRSRGWLKVKCVGREEFVIVGWTDPRGSRRYFGSLLLGFYDAAGRLHFAGGVGTGFNEARLREVYRRLSPLERKTSPLTGQATDLPPYRHWAEPRLVCEVRFSEYTRDRHVRHPSFLGLREDKKASDVVLDPRAGTALRLR
jgi:bifunctional non-homologous end joining protein LigD